MRFEAEPTHLNPKDLIPSRPEINWRRRRIAAFVLASGMVVGGIILASCAAEGKSNFTPASLLENPNANSARLHISGDDHDGDGLLTLTDAREDHPGDWPGSADVNGNGEINESDKSLVESHIGTKSPLEIAFYDVDGDLKVCEDDSETVSGFMGQVVADDEYPNIFGDWLTHGVNAHLMDVEFEGATNDAEEKFRQDIEELGYKINIKIPQAQSVPGFTQPPDENLQFVIETKDVNILSAMEKVSQLENVVGVDWNIDARLLAVLSSDTSCD